MATRAYDVNEYITNDHGKEPVFVLEILSGLNQGETLKIGEEPVLIGGSPDCDIYLAEPNIDAPVLIIENKQNHLHLSFLDPHTGIPKKNEKKFAEDRFCLEGVWICISIAGQVQSTKMYQPAMTSSVPSSKASIEAETWNIGTFDVPNERENSAFWQHVSKWVWIKSGSIVMSSLCLCALTISIAQGVASENAELTSPQSISSPVTIRAEKQTEFLLADDALLKNASEIQQNSTRPDLTAANQQLDDKHVQTLNSILSGMAIERELPLTFKLEKSQGKLVLRGTLANEKRALLGRMLERFQREQGIGDIKIQVESARHALPFDIVQVTSGPYGNVVTDQGKRLFIGDQVEGYQLVAIQDHQLVFSGKSRITVAW